MPTPNDFSNYQFTDNSDASYKKTSMEQPGPSVFINSNEPPLPGPSEGNYPRTFDKGYGPAETEAQGNYPDTFSRVKVAGSIQGSGEFGQALGEDNGSNGGTYPQVFNYGTTDNDRQKSSRTDGDPKALFASISGPDSSVAHHADLVAALGLHQPMATVGQHPWLRDGMDNMSSLEPGPTQPNRTQQRVPFGKDA